MEILLRETQFEFADSEASDIERASSVMLRADSVLNQALLCKWNWCFARERGALWRQIKCQKYREEEGGWCMRQVREAYKVGLW